ncbi:MAG TPA: hypothetical protein VF699_10360 [Caulobacteraceae bacterium]|jgi:predicted ATP-grasp superfamily ATP-dependent carboligase
MTHVLLFGNLRSSLTVARSLSRAGHVVHAGWDEPDPYLTASRHVAHAFRHALPDSEPEAALRDLLAYLEAHPEIEALAPVSEIAARLVSRHRERFPAGVRLLLPEASVVETCVDKAKMFDLCETLGVALARREIVRDHAALLAAVAAVGRPCVVKAVDSAHYLFGRKALILHEGDDAAALLPHWPAEHEALCVQTFVDGPRHDISFAAYRGTLIGAVDCAVLRTDRADGTGYTTELVSARAHPAVRHGLEALVAALDYTGVGDIEFMVDERSGLVSFVELNPRLSASFKSAEVCGLPMSRLMLEIGLGGAPAPRADPWVHLVGRRIAWTKGELVGLKRDWRAGELSRGGLLRRAAVLLRAALYPHHLTFDLGDPGPTLWLYLHPLLRRLGLRPRHERASAGPALEQLVGDGEGRRGLDLVPAG